MPWPFDREYMQLALAAAVVVGAVAPLMGVFLVQRRMSLMGDGIGHLAFAGVAGGVLLDVWPVWSALVVAVVGAVVIEQLRARGETGGDLALALMFYGGIAGGVVLVGLADSMDANVLSYLFGSILTVDRGEVGVVVALGALVAVAVVATARALFAMAVDEEWARVSGLPVGALNTLLAVLVAVTIVAAMRVVGLLLVAALMVLPVASGQLLARSQRGILAWSVGIGVVSAVAGLAAARAWGLAPGGTIVLVAVGLFAVVSVVRRRGPVLVPTGSHQHW
jgi:zinc transport system permease protein